MRCPRCDPDNPAEARFCNGCAAPLALACPSCGHANPGSSRFCNACASPLAAPPAAAAGPRFDSPHRYTPSHLAERILLSGPALAGERKQVTVLFADMKGSMELLGDRDAEQARALLDPVLERMMAAVHRYEGTVNQVMGDGIMALFGAPVAHEDHAVRACYASLRSAWVSHASMEAIEAVGGPESAGQRWWLGEHARAIAVCQRDLAAAANFRDFWALVVGRLRLGHLLARRVDQAADIGARARDLARDLGERGHEAHALRVVAETAAGATPSRIHVALAAFEEALALTAALGMAPLEARCRQAHARLLGDLGETSRAEAERTAARDLFASLDMRPSPD